MKSEEDEAFEYIERLNKTTASLSIDPYRKQVRNETIEEIARAIEKFAFPFGRTTVDSFAAYVRGMKQ